MRASLRKIELAEENKAAAGLENVSFHAASFTEVGDEIGKFDYSFDPEHCEDYPCRCGSKNCSGYIVGEEHRKELKKMIKAKAKRKKFSWTALWAIRSDIWTTKRMKRAPGMRSGY